MDEPRTATAEPALIERLRAAGCVFAEEEARLLVGSGAAEPELAAMVERRAAGAPLEQVLGWAQFCGRPIELEPGVFVPRRRSELLVAEATTAAAPGAVVVDLCCGSGAIGAAVTAAVDGAELHAADIDPVAVRCARRNLGSAGRVYEGDLFEPLPDELRGRIDVLVANAPYVPSGEIELLPREARLHEPRRSLDGGEDGLAVQRRLIGEAPGWLALGGRLLTETTVEQAPALLAACAASGLDGWIARHEDLDATVVLASRRCRRHD